MEYSTLANAVTDLANSIEITLSTLGSLRQAGEGRLDDRKVLAHPQRQTRVIPFLHHS